METLTLSHSDPYPFILPSPPSPALDLLSKYAPALSEAQLLSARSLFLNGYLDAAARRAADILRNSPEDASAHLLVCNVYLHQDQPALAQSALDNAVSANFAVRELPAYHVTHARVLLAGGKLEEAKKVLEAAMTMPGVRSALTPRQRARLRLRAAEPTLHERASVYLLLAEVRQKGGACSV